MGYERTRSNPKYSDLASQYGDDAAFIKAVRGRVDPNGDPAAFARAVARNEAGATPPQPSTQSPMESTITEAAGAGAQSAGIPPFVGRFLANLGVEQAKDAVSFARVVTESPKVGMFPLPNPAFSQPEDIKRAAAASAGMMAPVPAAGLAGKFGAGPLLRSIAGGAASGLADSGIRSGGDPASMAGGTALGAVMGGGFHALMPKTPPSTDTGAVPFDMTPPPDMVGPPVPAKPPKPMSKLGEPFPTSPPVAEGVSELSRMKEVPNPEIGKRQTMRGLKNLAFGYHAPEPLLVGKKFSSGKPMQEAVVAARRVIQDAPEEGLLQVSDMLNKRLTGKGAVSPAAQAELIRQHATAAGFMQDLAEGKKPPMGFTPQDVENDYVETAIALSKNPEAQAAYNDLRGMFDQAHKTMTEKGYSIGHHAEYSPIKSLEKMDQLLPEGERAGKTPAFMKQRGAQANLRGYDVIKNASEYMTSFKKKMAEDELFHQFHDDPAINLAATEEGRLKLKTNGIPDGYVTYEAPMGSPGFGKARQAKVSSLSKEASNAILARKDLIQRAARETDVAAASSLDRLERSRRTSNLLEDNAKAVTKSRELMERSLELAKKREAKMFEALSGDQRERARQARTNAHAVVMAREDRLARLVDREKVLIARAQKAAARVVRTEAEHTKTVAMLKKKSTRLMAKAEKVGQKAQRIKQQSTKKAVTMVIPTDVAEALSHFYERPMGHAAQVLNRAGSVMAQSATTLNIPNRATNIPSDLLMMLAGPAGEKGTFTEGIAARRLAQYPKAMGSMMNYATGGQSAAANEGRRLGAISGTFNREIGGATVPHDLAKFHYPTPMKERVAPGRLAKKALRAPVDFMRMLSTATEAAPRLATSQEGTARGLPKEEIRRLAHESSLPYGSGASKFARSKPAKAIARFITYPSLSDVRIVQGLTKAGSRSRYAALLTIPPAVAAQLNTRDAEHADAEKRLKPWIKNSLHFLVKKDDGTFDVVVVRADPFSEGTQRWGLGQLSGRVLKAAKGVEPFSLKSAPSDIKDAYTNIYPAGPIYQSFQGKDQYGRKLSGLDRVTNVLPFVRFGKEAFEATQKGGAEAGVKNFVNRGIMSGARTVPEADAFAKEPGGKGSKKGKSTKKGSK